MIVDGDENYEELLYEAEQEFYNGIVRVCDKRDGQYLAVLGDGTQKWMELSDADEGVIQYLGSLDQVDPSLQRMPIISDTNAWNLCP